MAAERRRANLPEPDREAAGRATLLRLLRVALVSMIVAVIGFYVIDIGEDPNALGKWEIQLITGWPYVLIFALVLAGGVIAIDVLTPSKKISTLAGAFLGLVAGVLAAYGVGLVLNLLAKGYGLDENPVIPTIKVLIGIALAYLGVSIVLQTKDEFRLIIPYVEFAKEIRGAKPLLLDTSAIIDGRVLDVAETGLLQAPLVVPRFVLAELQTLADSSDRLKRARGRRGLDIVTRLQRSPTLDVTIDETPVPGKSADQMLVELARRMPGTIVTTDGGLNRVASIQGVVVINMNEVANALKPNVVPGEPLRVRLIKPGEHAGQAVGYLESGAMVVAEDGADHIGEEVELTVTSMLQTAAGRLIFGRLADRPDSGSPASAAAAPPGAPDEIEPASDGAPADGAALADGAPARGGPNERPPGPAEASRTHISGKKRTAARNPRRG